jgi:phospholipase C
MGIKTMLNWMRSTTALVTAAAFAMGMAPAADAAPKVKITGLNKIGHIVVIYAENHSFDEEFGGFPNANGLKNLVPDQYVQRDRDGSVMAKLPPVFGGVIDGHEVNPNGQAFTQIPQSATTNMPNAPFSINAKKGGMNLPASVATRDMYHRFYENQMQIDGGKNDKMAAWADSGGMVMGHYDYSGATKDQHPLWQLAKDWVLADNFFQSAFGGSYLNHQYLICACANTLTPAQQSRPTSTGGTVTVNPSVLNADGVTLTTNASSPASSLNGPPSFVNSSTITPLDATNNVYYFVNTAQPPYLPTGNTTVDPGTGATVPNLDNAGTVPPQTATTIGDELSTAGVSWAWYAGAMQYAIDHGSAVASLDTRGNQVPNFQFHHNPFNYYANFAPGTQARADHLKDGGLGGDKLIADIDAGNLPAVTFYKPQGNLNGHPGYTDLTTNDEHVIDVVNHLMAGPQWNDMVIIVTYDEFGGQWDHVAPPKGDAFGPGTRIPAIIISPFARKHKVDHTQYDTTSILKLITEKYALPMLPGLTRRDQGLVSNGGVANGDLTFDLKLN